MATTPAVVRTPIARSDAWRRLLSARNLISLVVVVAVFYLAVVPLAFLLWQTFVQDGSVTVEWFREAYSSIGLTGMAMNSIVFAVGSTVLAISIGTLLAYLIVRTDVPFKSLMFAASLVPLIIPGILHTIAWIFLASPQIGIVNLHVIQPLTGGRSLNVFSLPGMILVEGLHLAPLVFLLMVASFRSMDPSLEESAVMSGAPLHTVFRRITIPLARPALYAAILIMVVRALESFEVPALLGLNGGVWVFTSRIWQVLKDKPPSYGEAGALSMSLLVLTSIGIYLHSRLAKRSRSFQTVTGKGFRPRPVQLGFWRWPATLLILVYFVIAVVLPLVILVYASTQKFYSPPTRATLSQMSLQPYRDVIHSDIALTAAKNSILLGLGSATTIMLLMAVAAWIVVRTNLTGRWLIDNLAFLPLAVPGLVLGVGLLFVYLRLPGVHLYNTIWILFMAYLTRYMPYGMRYATTSMFQIGRELEESAMTSGAGWFQSFRRIVLPLLMPGLVAGWIYILIVSVRELSSTIILYSPGKEVLSILIWEMNQNGEFPQLAALGTMMVGALVVLVTIAYKLGARIGVREA
ncbi:MAG: iron(III) transport system permease protein [Gaiellaceae bacterium]|nr:iron(III) transport system permease protein [Gaiellaceae bacterium]